MLASPAQRQHDDRTSTELLEDRWKVNIAEDTDRYLRCAALRTDRREHHSGACSTPQIAS
ncbi:MAG: hypothetical protein ACR2MB_16850 [Acidimicrobiales bacterium]